MGKCSAHRNIPLSPRCARTLPFGRAGRRGPGGARRRADVTEAGSAPRSIFLENTIHGMKFLSSSGLLRSRSEGRELSSPFWRNKSLETCHLVWISCNQLQSHLNRGVSVAAARAGLAANGVARKWRRNGLKRLNPRPEMVWARKPRTYNIWYASAWLTGAGSGAAEVAEKGA